MGHRAKGTMVTLTCDRRIISGADAALFLRDLQQVHRVAGGAGRTHVEYRRGVTGVERGVRASSANRGTHGHLPSFWMLRRRVRATQKPGSSHVVILLCAGYLYAT